MVARSSGAHPVLPRRFFRHWLTGLRDRVSHRCEIEVTVQSKRSGERPLAHSVIEAVRAPVEVGTSTRQDGVWIRHHNGADSDHSEEFGFVIPPPAADAGALGLLGVG